MSYACHATADPAGKSTNRQTDETVGIAESGFRSVWSKFVFLMCGGEGVHGERMMHTTYLPSLLFAFVVCFNEWPATDNHQILDYLNCL